MDNDTWGKVPAQPLRPPLAVHSRHPPLAWEGKGRVSGRRKEGRDGGPGGRGGGGVIPWAIRIIYWISNGPKIYESISIRMVAHTAGSAHH